MPCGCSACPGIARQLHYTSSERPGRTFWRRLRTLFSRQHEKHGRLCNAHGPLSPAPARSGPVHLRPFANGHARYCCTTQRTPRFNWPRSVGTLSASREGRIDPADKIRPKHQFNNRLNPTEPPCGSTIVLFQKGRYPVEQEVGNLKLSRLMR